MKGGLGRGAGQGRQLLAHGRPDQGGGQQLDRLAVDPGQHGQGQPLAHPALAEQDHGVPDRVDPADQRGRRRVDRAQHPPGQREVAADDQLQVLQVGVGPVHVGQQPQAEAAVGRHGPAGHDVGPAQHESLHVVHAQVLDLAELVVGLHPQRDHVEVVAAEAGDLLGQLVVGQPGAHVELGERGQVEQRPQVGPIDGGVHADAPARPDQVADALHQLGVDHHGGRQLEHDPLGRERQLDLADQVGPGHVDEGQPVADQVVQADLVEGVDEGAGGLGVAVVDQGPLVARRPPGQQLVGIHVEPAVEDRLPGDVEGC
jgi:hypothetical protein